MHGSHDVWATPVLCRALEHLTMGPSQIYPNVCLSRLYEAGGHHDAASMESADQVSAHEDMNSAAAPRLPRRRPFSRTIPSGNHELGGKGHLPAPLVCGCGSPHVGGAWGRLAPAGSWACRAVSHSPGARGPQPRTSICSPPAPAPSQCLSPRPHSCPPLNPPGL